MTLLLRSDRPGRSNALAAVFPLFALWDYYLGGYGAGFRVFDFAGLGLLGAVMLVQLGRGSAATLSVRRLDARAAALIGLFTALSLWGVLDLPTVNWRPAIGVLLGVFVFWCFRSFVIDSVLLERVLRILILVNIGALVTQWATFAITGRLLNFHSMLGVQPRVFSAIFRPSGLYQEPSSYVHSVFLLVSLRHVLGRTKFDWVSALSVASILLTVSLYGFVVAVVLLLQAFWSSRALWVATPIVLLFLRPFYQPLIATQQAVSLLVRVNNVGNDASASYRLGSLVTTAVADPWSPSLWFGHGLSNDFTQFGSSGFGFVVGAGGLLSLALLFALVTLSAGRRSTVRSLIDLLVAFAAAPIWGMMYWWAWLGLYSRRDLRPDEQ